jgi:hypothetical protein
LRRSEGRSISRPQQSAWCNIHPSPVKKIWTFTSKRSFNVTPDFSKKTKCYLYVCQDLISYI